MNALADHTVWVQPLNGDLRTRFLLGPTAEYALLDRLGGEYTVLASGVDGPRLEMLAAWYACFLDIVFRNPTVICGRCHDTRPVWGMRAGVCHTCRADLDAATDKATPTMRHADPVDVAPLMAGAAA